MVKGAWSRFAQKAVQDQVNLSEGEKFLVLSDDTVEPEIAEECFKAGLSVSENSQLMYMKNLPYHEEPTNLTAPVTEAMKNSDAVLAIVDSRIAQTPECHDVQNEGTRILISEPGPRSQFLINGLINLEYEKMLENVSNFCSFWREEKKTRVTSEAGTNLTFETGDQPVEVSSGDVQGPGELSWFPGAMANVSPLEDTINGTIAVDGTLFPFGEVKDPVMMDLEEGVITKIYGGDFADKWRSWFRSLDDEVVDHLCHFSVGFNPRAEMSASAIMESERVQGAVTIGFGRCYDRLESNIEGGDYHVDVILKSPTIEVGGKTLVKGNSLNEEFGFEQL